MAAEFGFLELLVILLMGRDSQPTFLSMVDADDYFAARSIEVDTPAKLHKLAADKPDGTKGVAARLLAIRTIGERKDAEARKVLESIAKTETGLAKDYAERALAAIDGKELPATSMPKGSIADDAAGAVPASYGFFIAADARGFPKTGATDVKTLTALRKSFPDFMKRGLHDVADKLGDVRVDRFSMGFANEAPEQGETRGRTRLLMRLHGAAADHKALKELITSDTREPVEEKLADIDAVLVKQARDPWFLFRKESDLFIFGWDRNWDQKRDNNEIAKQLVAVLSGKAPTFAKGAFAKDLAALPEGTFAVLLGNLDPRMQQDFAQSPFGVAPNTARITLSQAKDVVTLHVTGEFGSADDATTALKGLADLTQKAIAGLQHKDAAEILGAKGVKDLVDVIGKLESSREGNTVTIKVSMSADSLGSTLKTMFTGLLGVRTGAARGPVPEKGE